MSNFKFQISNRILYFTFYILLFTFSLTFVFAHEDIGQSSSDQYQELADKIKEYEAEINRLQGEGQTLQNQIAYMNSQIGITETRIQEAEIMIREKREELTILGEDIGTLEERIGRLERSVVFQENVFQERVRARYKSEKVSTFEILFFTSDLSDLVTRIKYLKVIEAQDRSLLDQMKVTRKNYSDQKNLLEVKKAEVEQVKADIESQKANLELYKTDLDRRKIEKQALLLQTKNSEAKFQELLAQARSEQLAIESAILAIDFADGTPVSAGDVIAVMGNTGYPNCSTGPHLHFEVREGGIWVNRENYLELRTVVSSQGDGSDAEQEVGSGSWSWPMNNPIVTQRYGETPWSWRYSYSGGIHTGVDMVDNSNSLVYAPADGVVVKGSTSCGGALMNFAAVDHGEDVVSYYFHIQ